jgi:hypothetical protein
VVISLIGVGGKIKASLLNQLITQVNGIALTGIVPTAVSGSGVTVSPNGKVTFTNATVVALDGVFSGTYSNYRITWNSPTRSASGSTQFHLRQGGTDFGANYDYVKGVDSGTTRSVSSSSAASAIPLDQGVIAGQTSDGVLDLFGPASGSYTTGTAQSAVLASSALYSCQVAFANEQPTVFDGFSLYGLTSGQTWSGTVRVYGYNTLT